MLHKHLPSLRGLLPLFFCVACCTLLFSACALLPSSAAPAPAAPAPSAPAPSASSEPKTVCELPDFQYETEAYALSALRTRGAMAVVEYEETGELPAGLVTSQSVEAGVCAENGKPVTLVVSKELSPTPTPTPTPKPAKKPRPTEELPLIVPDMPVVPIDPMYPTVTPQPTQDPALFEFLTIQPDTLAESCG